ncbi:MAG TPA: hypothetical protein VI792_11120 [Candidatus Eisenbacteria bacterium]
MPGALDLVPGAIIGLVHPALDALVIRPRRRRSSARSCSTEVLVAPRESGSTDASDTVPDAPAPG